MKRDVHILLLVLFFTFFISCLLSPDKEDTILSNFSLLIYNNSLENVSEPNYSIPIYEFDMKGETGTKNPSQLWSGKPVQELNIDIEKISIVEQNTNVRTILSQTTQIINILGTSQNEPALLSNTNVKAGTYKQIELVLGDKNTVKIDGKIYPLLIPNANWKGLILKGPFTIPSNSFFKLMLNFIANESLFYHSQYGFILKPYIIISGLDSIFGIFRGMLGLIGSVTEETIIQLNSDNIFKAKNTELNTIKPEYKNKYLTGNYAFSVDNKKIRFTDIKVYYQTGNNWNWVWLKNIKEANIELETDNKEKVYANVLEWNNDFITVKDLQDRVVTLYRTDCFDFDSCDFTVSYTYLTLKAIYQDNSKNGKAVSFSIQSPDFSIPPQTETIEMINDKATVTFKINNNLFINNELEYEAIAYLSNKDYIDTATLGTGSFISFNPNVREIVVQTTKGYGSLLSGNSFLDATNNPTINVMKDATNVFELRFPTKLNIRLIHNDWTNPYPKLEWDAYQGATKYFVMVLCEDRFENDINDDDNDEWDMIFGDITTQTSIDIFPSGFIFNDTTGTLPEEIVFDSGEKIRIEVFVLDNNSHKLNTRTMQGAIYMDFIEIVK